MAHFTTNHLIAAAYLLLTAWLALTHPVDPVALALHGIVSGAYVQKARAAPPRPPLA